MIAYLDSSVILRYVLGQQSQLAEFADIELGIASAMVEVECLRTLDRLRFRSDLGASEIALRREAVFRLLAEAEVVQLGSAILRRASQALPVPVGTLDALHLATALLWRDVRGRDLIFATHNRSLGAAARASGIATIGID